MLPVGIFLTYSEIGFNYLPTSYSVLKNNFYKKEREIEVLVIGSSDSQLGISPRYFQNVKGFNLSNVSQTIYTSYKLVTSNLMGLKNLKLVVLSIDPCMLFLNDNANAEKWREKFYYHYWNILPEDKKNNFTWNYKIGIYDAKTIITYAMQGFPSIPIPLDSLGWERGYLSYTKDILNYKTGKEIAESHFKCADLCCSKNAKYIINLNNILKKQDTL